MGHLRGSGVSDAELLAADLATTSIRSTLIDRFRDRVVFPINDPDGNVLGFVARRNPTRDDDPLAGPNYVNTATFAKGDQLYTAGGVRGMPVVLEGP